jgi:hypothetical protein
VENWKEFQRRKIFVVQRIETDATQINVDIQKVWHSRGGVCRFVGVDFGE